MARSTHINRRVAEAMGESELADVIQKGIDAQRAGDTRTRPPSRFGPAVRLAAETATTRPSTDWPSVVDIEDAATGLVRPKAEVEDADVMIVETRSTRTVRPGRDHASAPTATRPMTPDVHTNAGRPSLRRR